MNAAEKPDDKEPRLARLFSPSSCVSSISKRLNKNSRVLNGIRTFVTPVRSAMCCASSSVDDDVVDIASSVRAPGTLQSALPEYLRALASVSDLCVRFTTASAFSVDVVCASRCLERLPVERRCGAKACDTATRLSRSSSFLFSPSFSLHACASPCASIICSSDSDSSSGSEAETESEAMS